MFMTSVFPVSIMPDPVLGSLVPLTVHPICLQIHRFRQNLPIRMKSTLLSQHLKLRTVPNHQLFLLLLHKQKFFRFFGLLSSNLSWDEVKEKRDKELRPILNTIFNKAERLENSFPPAGPKEKAITYLLNQKSYLMGVLDAGEFELTNLPCERTVKRFVMWRKNSLFSFSEGGAERMSRYMTLLLSAKVNHLKPEEYLVWVLRQMRTQRLTDEDLEDLLPYSPKIPDFLRTK